MSAVPTDSWRGVAGEDVDDVSSRVSGLLRRRSRRLLGDLAASRRALLGLAGILILLRTGAQLAVPYVVGLTIDRSIRPGAPAAGLASLGAFCVLLLALITISAAANNAFLRVSGAAGQDVLYELRTRLFRHVIELSLGFYERYTSGRIIARLTSDIDALSELLATGLASVVTSVLSIAAIAVILLRLDLRLGSAVLLCFPLIVVLTRWFRANSERSYRAVRRAIALVIVHYTESLSGIRAVHAYRREPRNQEIFEEVNGRYRDANIWSNRLASTFGPGVNLMGRGTTAVVLVFGGYLVTRGSLTLGVLTAFILYVRQFFEPMQELSQFYNIFQAAAAALEKVAGVLEERNQVPEPLSAGPGPVLAGSLEIEAMSFGYGGAEILHGLNLRIEAGQVVALVGQTGAGKSTLARLVSRFYDPQRGAIRIDGRDLRSLSSADLRRAIVMVTQESFLFSGTVAGNIAVGRPGATREAVVAAARAVGAHGFIEALPHGYDTDVRRRGLRLSSGQRQLVAFARAFLADPRVLILDEATSSLDLPSERLVQRALRTLLSGRTALIIAHRLSTVEIADRILVMDAGRVVEDGPPGALLGGAGRYAALHSAWVESLA